MKRTLLFAILVSVTLVSVPAAHAAQAARKPPAQPGNRQGGTLTPMDVVGMLDAYAIVQAQNALKLNDAQYGPFVARLRSLQETRRRNQQARNRILRELRRLADVTDTAPPDEPAIRDQLKKLREHDDRAAAELRRAYEGVDEVIDVSQQARFRIFEETIERRKLELLMRARQAARRGSGG